MASAGGEGGGVLARWIFELSAQSGYMAQGTSVPSVARDTGYYIEIVRRSGDALHAETSRNNSGNARVYI